MQHHGNVILVGFMGTGKTTIGRALASKLKLDFVDMDVELEARAGKPIPLVFRDDGEPAFRRMERSLVVELSQRRNLVIAAGGGVVLNPDNLGDFKAAGRVICLKAQPDEIIRRLAGCHHRPLLETGDKGERVRSLLAQRQPLYDAIPCQVDTTGKTPGEILLLVLAALNSKIPAK